MRILVINPNTSADMTEDIYQSAVAAKQSATEVSVTNPSHGPECVAVSYTHLPSEPYKYLRCFIISSSDVVYL